MPSFTKLEEDHLKIKKPASLLGQSHLNTVTADQIESSSVLVTNYTAP